MSRPTRHPHRPVSPPLDAPRLPESGTFVRSGRQRVIHRPDPRLSLRSAEVSPDDPAVATLARVLVETMYASPASVGLAAPQLGRPLRVLCVDVSGHPEARSCAGLVVLANPRIVGRAGNLVMHESCASVPHLAGAVARAEAVTVEGTVPGSTRVVRVAADGIEARYLLHELDHLDGYLLADRMLEGSEGHGGHAW